MNNFFPKTITDKQASDTGMAFVLIFLLLGVFTGNTIYFKIAIPILVINMTFPKFFYPLAIVWLGLTNIMGAIVSKVLLSAVYFLILLPVGLARRLFGKDPLQTRVFKKNNSSVMLLRNHTYSAKDIETPY